MTRWYENIVLDEVFDLGEHTFGEDEIIRFARAYDPQYFHTDPTLAADIGMIPQHRTLLPCFKLGYTDFKEFQS